MSDRIERLRLTSQDAERLNLGHPSTDLQAPKDHWAFASAQLDRVLSAEVTCPRCEGTGIERKDGMEYECRLCGDTGGIRFGYKKIYMKRNRGTGRVTVRQILERDGGEK